MLRNDAGVFAFVNSGFPATSGTSTACAWADYDGDGDLDVYLAADGANKLVRNDIDDGNHWLHLDLEGVDANRDAVGAAVRVVAGGTSQWREVRAGEGHLAQHSLTVEFGLGAAAIVDTVEIAWPGTITQTLTGLAADQRLTVVEGVTVGVDGATPARGSALLLLPSVPNPFNPATEIRFRLPADGPVGRAGRGRRRPRRAHPRRGPPLRRRHAGGALGRPGRRRPPRALRHVLRGGRGRRRARLGPHDAAQVTPRPAEADASAPAGRNLSARPASLSPSRPVTGRQPPIPPRRRTMTRWLAILLVTLAAAPAAAADFGADDFDAADMRLLRNPDIHGDKVVFVHAGDLWLVGDWGGTARRLTSHVGSESQPKFSPDGRWIAFSADYDGNNDVYVMPSEGGEPRRLTWHPYPDRVIDWEPDGRAVRFQSSRTSFTRREADLWRVPVDGGLPTSLGLPAGGLSSWNADGTRLAYNRITREHRTWKRYQGGMAQNIWIYDFAAETTEQVTDWPGSENYPMWHGARIVFNSDRTGRLQLWAYDTGSGAFEQLTSHDEYDVKLPSLGDGRVVYENGGWLWVLDLADGETRRLEIAVRDDRVRTRATFVEAGKSIRGADLGPDAQRAVFAARGEIFTVPAEKGEVRNLSRTPGVHERHPAWSPDGAWIAYFSDASGEYELTVRRSDGRGEPRQVTEGSDIYYHDVLWSPDSRHLLTYDASRTVRLVELDSGDSRRIAQDPPAAASTPPSAPIRAGSPTPAARRTASAPSSCTTSRRTRPTA